MGLKMEVRARRVAMMALESARDSIGGCFHSVLGIGGPQT